MLNVGIWNKHNHGFVWFSWFEMGDHPHTSFVFLAWRWTQRCNQAWKNFLLLALVTHPLFSPVLLRANDQLNRSHFNLHNGIGSGTPMGGDSYDPAYVVIRCLCIASDSITLTQWLAWRSKLWLLLNHYPGSLRSYPGHRHLSFSTHYSDTGNILGLFRLLDFQMLHNSRRMLEFYVLCQTENIWLKVAYLNSWRHFDRMDRVCAPLLSVLYRFELPWFLTVYMRIYIVTCALGIK